MSVENQNTENDYAANLAAIGETFDDPSVNNDGATNEEASNLDPQVGSEPKTEETNAQGEGSKPADTNQQGSGPNSTGKQGKEEKGQAPSGPKDLTLGDGTVVKGGAERRWYETAQIAKAREAEVRKQLDTTTHQLTQLQTQVQSYETSLKAISTLPAEQVAAASRLYADLARDMPGTLQKLLVEAKALGHNIEGIGQGVDTAAIARMLEARNASSETQGQQRTPTQQEIDQEAEREVGEFFGQYPDAVMHEALIADAVIKHPDVPIRDIYFSLRENAVKNGYDWYQPLIPQIQARRAQQANPQPQQQQQTPMVNGRAAPAVVEEKITFSPAAGETLDDIIRASMKDHGYMKN